MHRCKPYKSAVTFTCFILHLQVMTPCATFLAQYGSRLFLKLPVCSLLLIRPFEFGRTLAVLGGKVKGCLETVSSRL